MGRTIDQRNEQYNTEKALDEVIKESLRRDISADYISERAYELAEEREMIKNGDLLDEDIL